MPARPNTMNGTTRAFLQRQLEQSQPWIVQMARRYDFEDLYQEIWAECLELGEVDWQKRQHSRIRAIAGRLCRAEWHRRNGQGVRLLTDCHLDDESQLSRLRPAPTPPAEVERQETLAIVATRLAKLAPEQRRAVEQHFFAGVPDPVIAARCRVGVNEIRLWRSRILGQLRAELGA